MERIDFLYDLRKRLEQQIEEADKKIVETVNDRMNRGVNLGTAVPGTDYYYLAQSLVILQEAHRAVLRQINMTFTRMEHSEAPYGMVLPEA